MATGSLTSKKTLLTKEVKEWLQDKAGFIIPPAIAFAVLLFIWQALCSGPKPPLPPPSKVIADTYLLIIYPFFDSKVNKVEGLEIDKGMGWLVLNSLRRVGFGYSAAVVAGVGLGIVIGTSKLLYRAFDPIFQVLRTIPPLAWLPIALAGFQALTEQLKAIGVEVSEAAAIFVIFITSVWPILMNTAIGVQQVPQDYRNVSKVLRLSKIEYFFTILVPSAAPYIFTGLRIAVGLSWLAIVAAEMLTGGVGIGFFIWDSYNSGKFSELILALGYIGIVGFLLDKLIFYVSKFAVQSDS
ncbi:nitrate ABC transporter permease [Pseudanabaena sp. PCC 6802]|uniref:nitrate ABC transporter permease n=1 Tax=Pseudanabaena sp. PCC 6802 TaxID=118173 RepID=UPI00034A77F9|nr:nitrate ABC transporter permease [Pseudanabaena sp. PCC 6802]